MTLIDGKAIAQQVRDEVREEVAAWVAEGHDPPGLATVLVGDDAGERDLRRRQAEGERRGRDPRLRPPARPQTHRTRRSARSCTSSTPNPAVNGILLQLPTPPQVDGPALTEEIDPGKDVDGLTPISTGLLVKGLPGLRPCTPSGVMELLRRHDVALEGAEAVVVGRSDLVGKPISAMLLAANATVTTCHSRTRDLAAVCRRADVLIAAVGVPELVKGDWIKEGAVVIDVGMNRTDAGLDGRRRVRIRRRPGGADHARPRRRRPDDDRDAPAQHPRSGEGRRLMRRAEPVAGLGGILLLVSLFLPWYGVDRPASIGDASPSARPRRAAGRSSR